MWRLMVVSPKSALMTSLTGACAAARPARSSNRATRRYRGISPTRVLRVRCRPRHALDLLLRDGAEVVLVRDVRRRVRVPRPDPGEEEVFPGPMQVVPARHLAGHLALALVHDEIDSHLAGGHEDRGITLVAHRA